MRPGHILFKTLAVSSSLLLAGGYVWYRAGAAIPYIAPARQQHPAPMPKSHPNEVVVPQDILDKAESNRTLLSGSKSDRPDVSSALDGIDGSMFRPVKPPPTAFPYPDFEYIQLDIPRRDERTILGGSKSSALDFRHIEPTEEKRPTGKFTVPFEEFPTLAPPPNESEYAPKKPRVVLPGPKSFAPDLPSDTNTGEPRRIQLLRPRIPDVPQQQAQSQSETPKKERSVLPGSKSLIVRPDRNDADVEILEPITPKKQEAPPQPPPQRKPEAQQEVPAQQRRQMLPGSKSSGFRERD